MMVKRSVFLLTCLVLAGGPANAQEALVGEFLCTVAEEAGIASIHLEDAGPPEAYVDEENLPMRFLIRIEQRDGPVDDFALIELDYDGPDRDMRDYGTPFSVIHETYRGSDGEFRGPQSPSYFSLYETAHANEDGSFAFYQSGFQYPGGEDTELVVRWGRCRRL